MLGVVREKLETSILCFFFLLQSGHFFTEFQCEKVLVTFQPIPTFRTSPNSVDWGWKQQMLKTVDTVCRQWQNRQVKRHK